MPLTRSTSASVDPSQTPQSRGRNRKRSIGIQILGSGSSRGINLGVAPTTTTTTTPTPTPTGTTTSNSQSHSPSLETQSLQIFAARRPSSPYDDELDARLFETLKGDFEPKTSFQNLKRRKRFDTVDDEIQWVMIPTTWYLDDPHRPLYGTSYVYTSKPPLSSNIRFSDLPYQSQADIVPVGCQLSQWKRSTPIPHLSYSQSQSQTSQSLSIHQQQPQPQPQPQPQHPTNLLTNRILNRDNEKKKSFLIETIHPDKSIQELWDRANGRSPTSSLQQPTTTTTTTGDDIRQEEGSTISESFIGGVQSTPFPVRNGRQRLIYGGGDCGEKSGGWLDCGMDDVRDWDWGERGRFGRGIINQLLEEEGDVVRNNGGGNLAVSHVIHQERQTTSTWSEGITSIVYSSNSPPVETDANDPSSPRQDSRGRTLAPVPRPPTSFVLPPLTQQQLLPTTMITTTTTVDKTCPGPGPGPGPGGSNIKRKFDRIKSIPKKTTIKAQAGVGGAARLAALRKLDKMKTSLSPFKLPGSGWTERASSAPVPTPISNDNVAHKNTEDLMEGGGDETEMGEMSEPELQDEDNATLEVALGRGSITFGTAAAHSTLPRPQEAANHLVLDTMHGDTTIDEEPQEEDEMVAVIDPLPSPTLMEDQIAHPPSQRRPTDAYGLRRRAAREHLSEDLVYSSILDIFPETHIPNPSISTDPRTISEQSLILKTYSASPPLIPSPNPFHPQWTELQDNRPNMRVCWIIPIHGTVFVDGLSDENQPSGAKVLATSTSVDLTSDEINNLFTQRRESRRLLLWTHADLLSLYAFLVKQRRLERYGSLSIRICTSSPDPFRTRPSSMPTQHRHLGSITKEVEYEGCHPVRPEIGTHFRIYMDLRWASRFRYLLSGFQSTAKIQSVPVAAAEGGGGGGGGGVGGGGTLDGGKDAAVGDGEGTGVAIRDKPSSRKSDTAIHLMYKKRLVLLGEMGEALVMI